MNTKRITTLMITVVGGLLTAVVPRRGGVATSCTICQRPATSRLLT